MTYQCRIVFFSIVLMEYFDVNKSTFNNINLFGVFLSGFLKNVGVFLCTRQVIAA